MGNPRTQKKKSMVSPHRSASMRFAEEMEGASMYPIDPRDCVPLIVDRDRYDGGVQKMKRIFRGVHSDGTVGKEMNISAGSTAPVVVQITDMYRLYLGKALLDMGHTQETVAEKMAEDKVWYGVVDGNFSLWALLELIEEEPEIWGTFRWTVLVTARSPSVDRLKQIKRTDEESRKAENCIEVTLYDEYQRTYEEYKRLLKGNKKKATSTAVANAYDGKDHKSTDSVSQKARTAIRLGPEVIREIGEIINSEHPELSVADLPDRHPGKADPSIASSFIDCRVFKSFISDHALKMATNYMNRLGEESHHTQVHVLHRLRGLYRTNGYKCGSYKVVIDQYSKCRKTMEQCKAFELFIASTSWPDQLQVFRLKMLRGTDMDDEIASNYGNGEKIVPSLLREFKGLYPDDFARCEMRVNEATMDEPRVEPVLSTPDDGAAVDVGNTEPVPQDGDGVEQSQGPDMSGNETERRTALPSAIGFSCESPLHGLDGSAERTSEEIAATVSDNLKKVGIEVHNVEWESYSSSVRREDAELFDCAITDPPFGTPSNPSGAGSSYDDHLEDKDFLGYGEALFKFLRRGGYAFLFSSDNYTERWKKSLRSAGFHVWDGSFVMTKSLKGRQLRRKGLFPQMFSEFGILARKPGHRTDGFKPDFMSPYEWISSKFPRRLAVIDDIPLPRPKLRDPATNKIVRVEEKSVALLMELLKTFCPVGGSVFDGFGGTLSMAIAALRTGRRAVVVEKDEVFFTIAKARLMDTFKDIYKDAAARSGAGITRLSDTALLDAAAQVCAQLDAAECCDEERGPESQTTDHAVLQDPDLDDETGGTFDDLTDLNSTLKQPTGVRANTGHITESQAQSINRSSGRSSQETVPSQDLGKSKSRNTPTDRSDEPGPAARKRRVGETIDSLEQFVQSTRRAAVRLCRMSSAIGTAVLATSIHADGDKPITLRRVLHGQQLDSMAEEFKTAVFVRRCHFQNRYENTAFDGPDTGVDDRPETLKEISPHAFVLWPVKDIQLQTPYGALLRR